MKICEVRGQVTQRLERGYALEIFVKWLRTRSSNRAFIHAGRVIFANLSLDSGALRIWPGRFFKNLPQNQPILLLQLRIDVPTRLIRRNGIVLDPSSAYVLEEVRARVSRPINRPQVEAGCVLLGRSRCCFFGLTVGLGIGNLNGHWDARYDNE